MNNNSEDLNNSVLVNYLSHESQSRAINVDASVPNSSEDFNVTSSIVLQSSQEELSISSAISLPSSEWNTMSGREPLVLGPSIAPPTLAVSDGTAPFDTSTSETRPTTETIALADIKTHLRQPNDILALASTMVDGLNSAPKKFALCHNHRSHIRGDDDNKPVLTSQLSRPSLPFDTQCFAQSAPVNTSLRSLDNERLAADAAVSPANLSDAGRDRRPGANAVPPPSLTPTPAEGILPAFIANLHDRSPDVRRRAASALMCAALRSSNQLAIARAGAVDLLVALLDDPDIATRRSATATLKLLAQHPENRPFVARPEVVNPLASLLSDPDVEGVQRNAGDALVNIARLVNPDEMPEARVDTGGIKRGEGHHEGIIPALISNLRDAHNSDVRRRAASALMCVAFHSSNQLAIARAGAVDLLVALLDDPDIATRRSATATLKLLAQHPENGPFVARPEVVNPLASLLSDPDVEGVQRNAGDALVNIARLVNPDEMPEARVDTGGIKRGEGHQTVPMPLPALPAETPRGPSDGCIIS